MTVPPPTETEPRVGIYGAYNALDDFWYKPAYEKLLAELSALPPEPRTWVEVGVFHGAAVKWLGRQVIQQELDVAIHCVDTFEGWPCVSRGQALRHSFVANTMEVERALRRQSQWWEWREASLDAVRRFHDASCDVVWLDADHSYEAVKADIDAWWPKVKPGGWLGGDDWVYQQGGDYGVRRAVQERFSPEQIEVVPGTRVYDDGHTDDWPSWLVRKSGGG